MGETSDEMALWIFSQNTAETPPNHFRLDKIYYLVISHHIYHDLLVKLKNGRNMSKCFFVKFGTILIGIETSCSKERLNVLQLNVLPPSINPSINPYFLFVSHIF